MAYFLFVDESGTDGRESPYMVLGGLAVKDSDLWALVCELVDIEVELFGIRYHECGEEIKGRKFLSAKTFRKAAQSPDMATEVRRRLASACLLDGALNPQGINALAQAKLAYVRRALQVSSRYNCKVFASIVDRRAPAPAPDYLRKDYSYLLERLFYFLEEQGRDQVGLVVFDELERQQSRRLINTMEDYFRETHRGRLRASQVIPQPFFVHSELTTGIQLADLACYILNWGFRLPSMVAPARADLRSFANQIAQLRHRTTRRTPGGMDFPVWSIAHINDLRPRQERTVRE